MSRFTAGVAFLVCLALVACAAPRPLPVAPDPQAGLARKLERAATPAVLFVGNSYSFGVPKAFARLAAERGHPVRVGQATSGGWTLARHAADERTLHAIRDGHWDVVVIQEQSEIPSFPPRRRDRLMVAPLQKLVTTARASGAVPVLYQTWGRRDGDRNKRHDDFDAMTARLREGYRAAAANAGGLVVVPAGDAWQRQAATGNMGRLFQPDGSHPTAYGDGVTAAAFCEVLFGK